ncbi:hypothetical protein CAPTEDRAFT_205113 [Capitella teleta]|uniref:Uncharacterized protein n=1 Tax=Capitella teleta TaxID=283909 RepID=R7TT25_CAPTE|nr:hypothetical protein CAPTEDRAFT_205113 [Capitella teleta]|eukprot:ELT96784.1 hypothetical protein CAPTEDRAFT_205113 [Capitella teleta]
MSFTGFITCSLLLILAAMGHSAEDPQTEDKMESVGIVHFNNPRLLPSDVEVPERYVFDTTQEDSDPRRMGGIHLREEARKLALKFRKLSNEEVGVTAMQDEKSW